MSNFAFVAIRKEMKRARQDLEWTQSDLAQELIRRGYKSSQEQISSYEKGTTKPSLDKLDAIAEALGKTWKLE